MKTLYTIKRRSGWHGQPTDPTIETTPDVEHAALRAGCRIDIHMPGGSNPYDAYAVDEDGEEVEPIDSFCCDECGELIPWGEYGPTGTMGGKVLECPQGVESHLVTWMCDDCAAALDDD